MKRLFFRNGILYYVIIIDKVAEKMKTKNLMIILIILIILISVAVNLILISGGKDINEENLLCFKYGKLLKI